MFEEKVSYAHTHTKIPNEKYLLVHLVKGKLDTPPIVAHCSLEIKIKKSLLKPLNLSQINELK